MHDSYMLDAFNRYNNMRLVHSSYTAVIRSYIWYVTIIHNVCDIYIYIATSRILIYAFIYVSLFPPIHDEHITKT